MLHQRVKVLIFTTGIQVGNRLFHNRWNACCWINAFLSQSLWISLWQLFDDTWIATPNILVSPISTHCLWANFNDLKPTFLLTAENQSFIISDRLSITEFLSFSAWNRISYFNFENPPMFTMNHFVIPVKLVLRIIEVLFVWSFSSLVVCNRAV